MKKRKKSTARALLFYTYGNNSVTIQDTRGNVETYSGNNLLYAVLDFKMLYGVTAPADLIRY